MNTINYKNLSPNPAINAADNTLKTAILQAWQSFYTLPELTNDIQQLSKSLNLSQYQEQWQQLDRNDDFALTEWLIGLFNGIFNNQITTPIATILVRGGDEPEYLASKDGNPARIEFAHGFFASSLHEISHWCIAGSKRRLLDDFGYWYEADGRDQNKQQLFEQVEIKPQAIECLLNMACDRYFYVSQDNLNADFDTSHSTFASDVYAQAQSYLHNPQTLPRDARRLLWLFLRLCQNSSFKPQEQ